MSQSGKMKEDNLTPVYLTQREGEIFIKLFRKHQDIWDRAEQSKPGTLVLHFDESFNINKYETHFYKKVK